MMLRSTGAFSLLRFFPFFSFFDFRSFLPFFFSFSFRRCRLYVCASDGWYA